MDEIQNQEQNQTQRPGMCFHYPNEPIFTIGERDFYCGPADLANAYSDWAAVIDCSGGLYLGENKGMSFPPGAERLYDHVIPVYQVAWADFSPPPVKFAFWKQLLQSLPEGPIVICCEGGHGRTGTAMAALLLASGEYKSASEALAAVREKYCHKAVETEEQGQYLIDYSDHLGNDEYMSSEDIEKALEDVTQS